jgi:hypothetical protein
MLALERRGRHRSRRLLGWLSLRLLAVLLNASSLVSHFSYRSTTQSAIGGIGRAVCYPLLRVYRNRCPAYQGAIRKNQAECKGFNRRAVY